MNDTINGQAAIDEWKNDFRGYINALNMPRDDYNGIMEYIDELPSTPPRWIPVTERLPEDNRDVLVTDGEDFAVAYWRKDAQAWDDWLHGWCDLYGLDVVAWMELPKPWKG